MFMILAIALGFVASMITPVIVFVGIMIGILFFMMSIALWSATILLQMKTAQHSQPCYDLAHGNSRYIQKESDTIRLVTQQNKVTVNLDSCFETPVPPRFSGSNGGVLNPSSWRTYHGFDPPLYFSIIWVILSLMLLLALLAMQVLAASLMLTRQVPNG